MENQRMLKWLEKSRKNDELEINLHKKQLLDEISQLTKEDVLPKKPKMTLWQRIKKTLNF
jgi:hypothetical protein